jgi:TRAP-type mannitol/chloroaromatic compound transport system permease small subunit
VKSAERLARRIDAFTEAVGRLTSWLALGLALVMGGNVLLRYGFAIGFIWSQELEWHILVPICLLGMSYALRHGEHVRVDVLFQSFSARGKHAVDVIAAVLAMLLSLIVVRLSLPYVMQSWSIGEGSANPGGLDYRYVIKAMIPIGFALFFVQSLSEAIKSYLAFREPERDV